MRSISMLLLSILATCPTILNAEDAHSDRLKPGSHDARLGDVTLHYVVAGHGSPVLVPSPNWGPGSLYLQRGLVPLERNHLLIFIDSRGSGASSKPTDVRRMSIDDMADDIENMRTYLGIDELDLIGHSAAGEAAIEYAERYHGHIGHLILVEAATRGSSANDLAESRQSKANFERLSKDPRYADAVTHLMNDPFPPPTDDAMMQGLKNSGALDFANPGEAAPRFAQTIAGMTPSSFAWRTSIAADRAKPIEQESKLGTVQAAVLVVQGKQDWLVPALTGEHIHEGIAQSMLLELDECGHFPWIEQPTKFFSAIDQFLSH
jgi:proline iminopeptidase